MDQMDSENVAEMVEQARQNHVSRLAQIADVAEKVKEGNKVQIGESGPTVEPDTSVAVGFRMGLLVAADMMGQFPISVSRGDGSEDAQAPAGTSEQ